MRKPHGLTKEQDELRLQGLRILARWIVRATLPPSARTAERTPPVAKTASAVLRPLRGRAPWTEGAMAGKRLLLMVRLDPMRHGV